MIFLNCHCNLESTYMYVVHKSLAIRECYTITQYSYGYNQGLEFKTLQEASRHTFFDM